MINCCVYGVPLPPYIKEQGGGRRPRRRARQGGSPTPTGSRTPPFLVGVGKGKGEGERRKGAPPSLGQFRLVHGEGCGHPLGPFSPFPYGPFRPNTNSRNSSVLRKIPESLGTFSKSEYDKEEGGWRPPCLFPLPPFLLHQGKRGESYSRWE